MAKIAKETDSKEPNSEDDAEDVLFEGELTWTHDPVPVSPELLKRTPRDAKPAKKHEHIRHPSEGSIELQDLREGGGEIFDIDDDLPSDRTGSSDVNEHDEDSGATDNEADEAPAKRDRAAKRDEPADEAKVSDPVEAAETDPFSNDEVAAAAAPEVEVASAEDGNDDTGDSEKPSGEAPASSHDHRATKQGHGKTIMPLNGFNKASASAAERFAFDHNVLESNNQGPKPATASQFAAEEDPSDGIEIRRRTLVLIILSAVIVLGLAGAAIYMFYIVPNRPEAVLGRALATTLQQPSVHLSAQADEMTPAKQPVMQVSLSGGVSQAGSFDLKAKLTNQTVTTPLELNARSLDGRDVYLQGASLAANLPYLTKLGLPIAARPTLMSLEQKWVRMPADQRLTLVQGLGLGDGSGSLTAADKQAMADIYKQDKFLAVSKTLPDVALDGTLMHHYQLSIDKTRLTAFLLAARAKVSRLGLTQQHITAANKIDTSTLHLEIWIDGDSSLVSQIVLVKQKAPDTVSWVVRLTQYGKTFDLQQPSAGTDTLGAFKQMVGPSATDKDGQALMTKLLSNYTTTPAAQP